MSDNLQELFARLQSQVAPSPGAGANTARPMNGYHQPTVSSPIYSPSAAGSEPHSRSAIMSPVSGISASASGTPQGHATQASQQSAQLLQLLRFGNNRSTSQPSIPPHQRNMQRTSSATVQDRPVSSAGTQAGSVLEPILTFPGRANGASQGSPVSPLSPSHHPVREEGARAISPIEAGTERPAPAAATTPQEILLKLLNQPKPPQTSADKQAPKPTEVQPENGRASEDAASSPMRVFGTAGGPGSSAQSNGFEPETAAKPIFTYVNPFDRLEAASPRARTPVARQTKPPAPVQILKPKHGLDSTASSNEHKDQPSKKSRKLSPAPVQPQETVAEAVSHLGPQVDKEVERALAMVESNTDAHADTSVSSVEVKIAQEAGVAEATKDNKTADEDKAPVGEPTVDASKEVSSDSAQADVADDWENAAADDVAANAETVTVFNFPMLPWTSITVTNMPQRRALFAPELFMDIARLKKEFDQIDRSLVAASKNYIVYPLAKKGGFRIIKQDNGQYRHVFENHQERIFNIALCSGTSEAGDALESIVAIGVNGSVFWTALDPAREDQFSDNLDSQGIVLPPSPTQDDSTSGGQLKTRAKPSSRHPDYFAVGRGKSIHIVWPKVAAEYVTFGKNICQTEKYLQERSLKILTGKAGKDFSFSEDDTVIVSLDKAGRMRFWDIRPLVDPELGIPSNPARQVEVSETLLEFHTTSPTAKSWPTSVFFFDKSNPFNKGIALRYVMVGMKQNHSFQLWDLMLGRAVQEINLPHEKESDAICSVALHPRSGVMAVAHPTRNSIYFIHVSCPRYNLPMLSQAAYIEAIANKNGKAALPAVQATAIMSSITEYSFAPKGQIRSLQMLADPIGPKDADDPENDAIFELYVMHSKGVCTVRIRRSDLGWNDKGQPVHGKKAVDEGVITVTELKEPVSSESESTTGGETPRKATSERSTRESARKENSNISRQPSEASVRASTLAKVESKQDAARAAIINSSSDKPEKKKKKRGGADSVSQTSSTTRNTAPSYAQAAQAPAGTAKIPTPTESTAAEAGSSASVASGAEAPEWAKKFLSQQAPPAAGVDLAKIEEIIKDQMSQQLSTRLDELATRLHKDKEEANEQFKTKQETLLRLVSSTLTDNIDGVFQKMVEKNTKDILLPKLMEQTTSVIEKAVASTTKQALATHFSKEVPDAVNKALKDKHVQNAIGDVVFKVTSNIESIVTVAASSAINPAMAAMEKRLAEQQKEAEVQRRADAARIAKLNDAVATLTNGVQQMVVHMTELQAQVLTLQQQLPQASQGANAGTPRSATQSVQSPPLAQQLTPEQEEAEHIAHLLHEGSYEQATMKWLQSNRTSELFNTVLVDYNPSYLSRVSPLLNLSAGAVVTDDLEQHLAQRLEWLDHVLANLDPTVRLHFDCIEIITDNSC